MRKKFNLAGTEWTVTQLACMKKSERELNQYAVITVDSNGGLNVKLLAVLDGTELYRLHIPVPSAARH